MEAVGIEEATLVGASTGAFFAQRVALSHPPRVSRLVLVGAQRPANEANEVVLGLQEEVRALEDPVPPEFVRAFQEGTIHYPVPREFLDTVVSESSKLPARVWRDYWEGAVLSIDQDYVLELREIDVPTLMLWGGAGSPLPARRTGTARGSDPWGHLEGLPRDWPRRALGPTGVGRPGSGGVYERAAPRVVMVSILFTRLRILLLASKLVPLRTPSSPLFL
jgi:pimeloyl-ACP methyl ester carboxylesterase